MQSDLLKQLSACQATLWETVSQQTSESTGQTVKFSNPETMPIDVAAIAELYASDAAIVQFTFAGQPDTDQAIVVPMETAVGFLATPGGEADPNALRAPLEAIVQSLCFALGTVRNEIVLPGEVSLRFGPLEPNGDLTIADAAVQVAVAVGATIGSVTWLLDAKSADFVIGQPDEVPQTDARFTPAAMPSMQPVTDNTPKSLNILQDIPLDISVELGRTRMVVRDVVELGAGSIVEIDKAAGEPVDVMVNGRLVARGEVVVIEDNFGVRITEILNPRERIMRLGEAA